MKIKYVTDESITFDNGDTITFGHDAECCEQNYADFEQIDSVGMEHDYSYPLEFELINGCGFRFGNSRFMTFIPCYSYQNGYYSSDIQIYYNGKKVLSFDCEEILYY